MLFYNIKCLYNLLTYIQSIDISNYEIIVSSYRTIIIDVNSPNGLISLEIGETKIGYFTDYDNKINEESDGLDTDFKTISECILKHLIYI